MREKKENYEILSTNIGPFFWQKKTSFTRIFI